MIFVSTVYVLKDHVDIKTSPPFKTARAETVKNGTTNHYREGVLSEESWSTSALLYGHEMVLTSAFTPVYNSLTKM
eukprot:5260146-Amphidinium_carterae.1